MKLARVHGDGIYRSAGEAEPFGAFSGARGKMGNATLRYSGDDPGVFA